MTGVELLQDLVHDGVGQVGDHGQLHLPETNTVTQGQSGPGLLNSTLLRSPLTPALR